MGGRRQSRIDALRRMGWIDAFADRGDDEQTRLGARLEIERELGEHRGREIQAVENDGVERTTARRRARRRGRRGADDVQAEAPDRRSERVRAFNLLADDSRRKLCPANAPLLLLLLVWFALAARFPRRFPIVTPRPGPG